MPTTVEFTVTAEDGRPLSASLLQLHGLACRVFEGPDSPVDHDASDKLFAVGPLAYRPNGKIEWHTSWLCDDKTPPVLGRPISAHLGQHSITLQPAAVRHRSFLALARSTATHAEITFLSPTSFHRSGIDALLPDPHLFFGSLARRWEVLAPPQLQPPTGLGRDLGRSVAVTSIDICSVRTDQFGGVTVREWSPFTGTYRSITAAPSRDNRSPKARTGFVGTVTFELKNRELEPWFGALVAFAPYCGVGRATTHGCGAVRSRLHDGRGARHTMSLRVPRQARPPGGTDRPRHHRPAPTSP